MLEWTRDPRWVTNEEGYGEDPYLISRMGVAAIEGLQGDSYMIDRHHVLATAKHFAVHGQPEGGTNTAPGNISERVIRETFLVPFEAAVKEAHVGSVMASYNEIDGVPSHVNHWLLDKVLRQEWGFEGFISSDDNGYADAGEHAPRGIQRGGCSATSACRRESISMWRMRRRINTLVDQVKQGAVPESGGDACGCACSGGKVPARASSIIPMSIPITRRKQQ